MDVAFETPGAAARAPDPPTRWSRALALTALIGLIVLGLAWELWLAPTGRGTLAIKVVPLVFCVLGVWRFRLRTYRWLCILVWLYVAEAAVRATTEGGLSQALAVLEGVLSLVLFSACAWHIRWRLRRDAAR